MILRSLLIVATPYMYSYSDSTTSQKASLLLNVLCNMTVELTFEKQFILEKQFTDPTPDEMLKSKSAQKVWDRVAEKLSTDSRCTVLQCVAVCCRCVAVCRSVLQCVAVCCRVLQCVAVCCSVLHCVAEQLSA